MMETSELEARRVGRAGFFFALAAYLTWGVMPLYYAAMGGAVDAWVIVGHRIVWTVGFLVIVLSIQKRWAEVAAAIRNRRTLLALLGSSVLIGGNWVIFVHSIVSEQVLHSALGYYICPLVSVLLGMVFFHERLRWMQWVSISVAALAVGQASWSLGTLPWISLTLATSFGMYGLIRKVVPVGATIGLLIESMVLLPLAVGYLLVTFEGWGPVNGLKVHALLIASGVVTALPLIWFSAGARRLRLSTLGFMQYISPTAQMLVGVLFLGETMLRQEQPWYESRVPGFLLIGIALVIFSYDGFRSRRALTQAAVEMAE